MMRDIKTLPAPPGSLPTIFDTRLSLTINGDSTLCLCSPAHHSGVIQTYRDKAHRWQKKPPERKSMPRNRSPPHNGNCNGEKQPDVPRADVQSFKGGHARFAIS